MVSTQDVACYFIKHSQNDDSAFHLSICRNSTAPPLRDCLTCYGTAFTFNSSYGVPPIRAKLQEHQQISALKIDQN